MKKPIFVTENKALFICSHEGGDGIGLMFGDLASEPLKIHIETKEEFTALVGELYRMWDQSMEAKN